MRTWVLLLLFEVKEFLDPRKHPFYKHAQAIQMHAGQGDRGILVSDDPNYNELHHKSRTSWGEGHRRPAADTRAGEPRSWARSTTRPTIPWAATGSTRRRG